MLKNALLALLAGKPRHGYELKAAFEEQMAGLWPALNIGQIYTTLARLERDGLVQSRRVSQEDRPDKFVYELTPAGRQALQDWFAQPSETAPAKDEFFVKLAFAHLAGENDLSGLISRQRKQYLQALHALGEMAANSGDGASPVTALLIEGVMLQIQAGLKWLDECEEKMRKGNV